MPGAVAASAVSPYSSSGALHVSDSEYASSKKEEKKSPPTSVIHVEHVGDYRASSSKPARDEEETSFQSVCKSVGKRGFPKDLIAVEQAAETGLQNVRDNLRVSGLVSSAAEGIGHGLRLVEMGRADQKPSSVVGGLNFEERKLYGISQEIREIADIFTIPFKIVDFACALRDDVMGVIPRVVVCFQRLIACVPPLVDLFNFLERREVVQVSKEVAATVGVVGSGASGVVNLYGVVEDVIHLTEAKTSLQVGLYVLNLAEHVAYTAAAVLLVVGFAAGFVFAPWILAGLGAIGVACTLTAFFYDKIGDPLYKNPDRLIISPDPLAIQPVKV